jgi:hypothetical protein
MRPMAEVFIAVLLVGWLVATVAVAGEREGAMEPCKDSYTHRRPTPEELATVLRNHQEWLKDAEKKPTDRRRANLCQADLRAATLQGAILNEANLQEADLSGATSRGPSYNWSTSRGPSYTGPTSRGLSTSPTQESSQTFGA